METVQNWLQSIPISQIEGVKKNVISVSSTDSISKVMEILAKNGITSVPVYSGEKSNFVGFVDVLDLAVHIVRVFAQNYEKHPHLYDPKELERMLSHQVSEVINASKRNPFMPVDSSWNLSFLINSYLRYGIHRVLVIEDNEVVGLVSQSDVIRFLFANRNKLKGILDKSLKDLGIDYGNVIFVSNEDTLMKAFTTILKHNVTGIAVVDPKGELVNNLSASDLKGVTETNFFKLEAQIHQILLSTSKLPPVTCTPDSKLIEILSIIEKTGVHRVYVVDKEKKPIQVITLTSILELFSSTGIESRPSKKQKKESISITKESFFELTKELLDNQKQNEIWNTLYSNST